MYLLSTDVVDPKAKIKIINPENGSVVETKTGGLLVDNVETHEGISRLVMADGKQIEQYPGIHAGFSLVAGNGVYGRCDIEGPLVAFHTRKEDPPFVYTLKRLP
jgi:hypothetical protein